MIPAEVIRRKRDGHALRSDEIEFVVRGITDGSLSDAQVGALAMALFLNGMEPTERVALTEAMRSAGVRPWIRMAIARAPTCASLSVPSAMPRTRKPSSSSVSSPPSRLRLISSGTCISRSRSG